MREVTSRRQSGGERSEVMGSQAADYPIASAKSITTFYSLSDAYAVNPKSEFEAHDLMTTCFQTICALGQRSKEVKLRIIQT